MNMPDIKIKKNGKLGKLLATIGVITVLSEVVMRILSIRSGTPYEMDRWVLAVGALLGFAGFWSIDSDSTTKAIQIVTAAVPKFGRRATDPIALPEAETHVKAVPREEAERKHRRKNEEVG